jgi:hypothetical protein
LVEGEVIPNIFAFACIWFFENRTIYEPYQTENPPTDGKKRIIIFPRYREHKQFSYRNLTKEFYDALIDMLCSAHPEKEIVLCGSSSGCYHFDQKRDNLRNMISDRPSLQDTIDICSASVFAIGGTSSLPKLSLMQGVETFIIGHERQRFTLKENWCQTKVNFYDVPADGYQKLNIADCLQKIREAIK